MRFLISDGKEKNGKWVVGNWLVGGEGEEISMAVGSVEVIWKDES